MNSILGWIWRTFLKRPFTGRVRDAMLHDARYAAKFYPFKPDSASYLVEKAPVQQRSSLPIPPQHLWLKYTDSEDRYLEIGKTCVLRMSRTLESAGRELSSFNRVLDFGAASGIMIRWLTDNAKTGEVWGVDISGEHMIWCQQHLSPPFKFATTTSLPHLPFEDGYFDLIYAGSVFSHIADLAEAWLLELRRITRPGGMLYLTVQDEHSIELYRKDVKFPMHRLLLERDEEIHFSNKDWELFTLDRTPGEGSLGQAQVFYKSEYLRRHWGQYLKVVSITPESYWYQSAVLLER